MATPTAVPTTLPAESSVSPNIATTPTPGPTASTHAIPSATKTASAFACGGGGCARCVLSRRRLADATQIVADLRCHVTELRTERNTVIGQMGQFAAAVAAKINRFKADSQRLRADVVGLVEGRQKLLVSLQSSLFEIQTAVERSEKSAKSYSSSKGGMAPNLSVAMETERPGPGPVLPGTSPVLPGAGPRPEDLARSFFAANAPVSEFVQPRVPDLSKVVAKLTRQNIQLERDLDFVRQQQGDLRIQLKAHRKTLTEQESIIDELRELLEETVAQRKEYNEMKFRYNSKRTIVVGLQKENAEMKEKYKKITKEAIDKEIQLQQVRAEFKNKDRMIFLLRGSLADRERELSRLKSAGCSYPSPSSCSSTPVSGFGDYFEPPKPQVPPRANLQGPSSSSSIDKLIPDGEREQENLVKEAFDQAMQLLKTPADVKDRRYLAATEENKKLKLEVERLDKADKRAHQLELELGEARARLEELEAREGILKEISEKLEQECAHTEKLQAWGAEVCSQNEALEKEVSDKNEHAERFKVLLAEALENLELGEKEILRLHSKNNALVPQLEEALKGLQSKSKDNVLLISEVKHLQHTCNSRAELVDALRVEVAGYKLEADRIKAENQRLRQELAARSDAINSTLRLTYALDNAMSSNQNSRPGLLRQDFPGNLNPSNQRPWN